MAKVNGLFQDQEIKEAMENGEICVICEKLTAEEYGRPGACEDCGGDFVLADSEDKDCMCTARQPRADDIDPPEVQLNKNCPVHGIDPDAAREKQRDSI